MIQANEKYYQTQLLELSSENSRLKSDILEIKVEHEEIIKQLSQTQLILAQTEHKLQAISKQNHIANQNYQAYKEKYNKSQNSYKSLFDYAFVDGGHIQQTQFSHYQKIQRNSIHSEIDFMNSLNKINYDFQQQRIDQLEEKLQKSNQSIKEIYQENSRLRVNIISLTTDYHSNLAQVSSQKNQLESELKILKQNSQSISQRIQGQISGKSEQLLSLQEEINNLKTENYNLMQDLQIERKKTQIARRFNRNFSVDPQSNDWLSSKSPQKMKAGLGFSDSSNQMNILTPIFGVKNRQKVPNIQEIVGLIQEKQQFERQNNRLRGSLNLIQQQFPNLFQSTEQIQKFTKRYEEFYSFEQNNSEMKEKLNDAEEQIRSLKQQVEKMQISNDQLQMQKWKKYQQSVSYVRKLKQVIKRIDPLFKTYGYNIADVFSEQQLRFLENGFEFEIETESILQSKFIKVEHQRNKIKEQLIIANKKLQRSTNTIQSLEKECLRNKAIIESQVLSLLKKTSNCHQGNYKQQSDYEDRIQVYQAAIKELQLQREQLSKSLIDQQTQITKLKAERDFYKLNRVQQTIVVSKTPSLRVKQFKEIKLFLKGGQTNYQFEHQVSDLRCKIQQSVKKCSNDLQMAVRYNLAQILRQRQKIQGLIRENHQLAQVVEEITKKMRKNQADNQFLMQINKHSDDQQLSQFHTHHIQRFSEANDHSINLQQASEVSPLNTVSEQSMGLLKKLLENYESLLKQKFSDFENLKNNYQQVQQKLMLMEFAANPNLKDTLQERENQLKNTIIQLVQAKENINQLEHHLRETSQEAQQIQQALQKQRRNHQTTLKEKNNKIEQLQESLEKIKQRLEKSMEEMHQQVGHHAEHTGIKLSINDPAVSSMMVMISSKKDEINDLKRVISIKNQNISELEGQLQKLQRRQVLGMHEKSPLERQEYMEVVRILEDGKMASLMGQVIQFLKKLKRKSGQSDRMQQEIQQEA